MYDKFRATAMFRKNNNRQFHRHRLENDRPARFYPLRVLAIDEDVETGEKVLSTERSNLDQFRLHSLVVGESPFDYRAAEQAHAMPSCQQSAKECRVVRMEFEAECASVPTDRKTRSRIGRWGYTPEMRKIDRGILHQTG